MKKKSGKKGGGGGGEGRGREERKKERERKKDSNWFSTSFFYGFLEHMERDWKQQQQNKNSLSNMKEGARASAKYWTGRQKYYKYLNTEEEDSLLSLLLTWGKDLASPHLGLFVSWLHKVTAASKVYLRTDLLQQLYMQPHCCRNCRPNLLSNPVKA